VWGGGAPGAPPPQSLLPEPQESLRCLQRLHPGRPGIRGEAKALKSGGAGINDLAAIATTSHLALRSRVSHERYIDMRNALAVPRLTLEVRSDIEMHDLGMR